MYSPRLVSRLLRFGLFTLTLSTIAANAATGSGAGAGADVQPIACTSTPSTPVRTLAGVVSDPTGAGVSNAQVTITCGDFRKTVTANSAGAYSIQAPAGDYVLTVEANSFATSAQRISLSDAPAGSVLNQVLHIDSHSSVTVTADNQFATSVGTAGTKTNLPLNEVPQTITVINRDLMYSQDVVKLDDALKNVASVMPGGYYDGYDYYRIRGFDASFNTYIDGLRGGNGVGEETWGLENVEVIKGPSSTLYGQSVLGGLVNITTKKPIPQTFGRVQFTGGTFRFLDPSIDIGAPLNRSHTVYGRLAAIYHWGDTYVNYTYRHRYFFDPSLTWHPREGTTLTLIGRIQRDNSRVGMPLPSIGTTDPNPNGVIPINTYIGELDANANKISQANQQFGYQFQNDFNSHFTLRQNARFAIYDQQWNRLYYPSYLASDNRTLYRYPLDWQSNWKTNQIDTIGEANGTIFGMQHNAILGVDFYRSPTSYTGAYGSTEPLDLYNPKYGQNAFQPTLTPYTQGNTVTQYTGIYLQDHIRLPKSVTLTAGGRIDIAKNETKGSPNQNMTGSTPRLGITWQAIHGISLYSSFSKSFLPQSYQSWNSATMTASYIKPETGQQWEGGAKTSFLNGKLLATAALFQLDRNNVAVTDVSSPNYYKVIGQQRSRGFEFETTLNPIRGWNITSAYSYINAIILKSFYNGCTDPTCLVPAGTPTINAPKNIFNIWSTYEVPAGPLKGFLVGLGGRHYTDQAGDVANSFQIPGYGLMDASASYRHGHTLWQFNANNITNKRYYAGSYSNVYVRPGEPRIFRGTVAYSF